MRSFSRSDRGAFSRGVLFLVAFAAACVLVPGLFWWGTTFTRRLDDAQLTEKLAAGAPPRDVQHAVEELSHRFQEGRPGMERWAEDLVRVSRRPEDAVRVVAAWCMQFDAERASFRARLRELVTDDAAAMVRRNAATSLARSGDTAALPVLRAMLLPLTVTAPEAGTARDLVGTDQPIEEGSRVATVETAAGRVVSVRAPVPGAVSEVLVAEGARVAAGAALLRLRPALAHVENALLALALVGGEADVALAHTAADARSGLPEDVRSTAAWAARAIEKRLGGE